MSEEFEVHVAWPADEASKRPPDTVYSRDSWLSAPGKPEVFGSSPPAFGGDPKGYNPEVMLILSLSQCHMLTFLALAAKNKLSVLHYEDRARGRLGKNAEGKMQMVEVLLKPKVTMPKGTDVDVVNSLHNRAHSLCFMANSVNFPVEREPELIER
jgi:organic hydroperoxide reductase OsmC/OhrA